MEHLFALHAVFAGGHAFHFAEALREIGYAVEAALLRDVADRGGGFRQGAPGLCDAAVHDVLIDGHAGLAVKHAAEVVFA